MNDINGKTETEFLLEINELFEKNEKKKLLERIIKIFSLLKKLRKKLESNDLYSNKSWDAIIDEFYKDKDIMRRFKLLHNIIFQKYICKDNKCPIFAPLREVAIELDDLPIHDLESLEQRYEKDTPVYKMLKAKIDEIALKLTKTFEDIFTLATTKGTIRREIEETRESINKRIEIKARYKLPLEYDLDDKESEKLIKREYDVLTSNDPSLQIKEDSNE